MFVGRKYEMERMNKVLDQKSGSILIYGKRKVGKTTLIRHTMDLRNIPYIYYECVKDSMSENLLLFTRQLFYMDILPAMLHFNTFIDLFKYLNSLKRNLIIVIDEYSYLKSKENNTMVDSIFQNIIDNYTSDIHLIVSGSHIGMMKEMLEEGNALYGRFDEVICLKELDYIEASQFYPDKSIYDKVAFYSVFGGSPFILSKLNASLSLKDNIVNTILNMDSSVYLYASHILLSDYAMRMNVEKLFASIGNSKRKYRDIEQKMGNKNTGNVAKQLQILMDIDVVKKVAPINKLNDNKKKYYEIKDNLLRFFYTYMYGNMSILQMLGADQFYDEYIEPSIITFISYRFEDICIDYFMNQIRKGKLKGVRNIGTYYYDDPIHKQNGEFEVVLDYGKKGYTIYEVKYLNKPMDLTMIHHELDQIQSISELEIKDIGFISIHGFEEYEQGYIYITGKDIYE
ncbi:MAG: AAA family ATPase [Holdemanella sp.]|nr:AAA family ATPase [Holdemanella sp.]